jgi:hypothetical protein
VTAPQLHRAPAIENISNCFRASKAYREVFDLPKFQTEALRQIAISGRVRWAGKPTVCPFHRIGFHGVHLVALHATEPGFARPVSHCHHELFALWAAVIIHDVLPVLGTIYARKTQKEVSAFIKKEAVSLGWFDT